MGDPLSLNRAKRFYRYLLWGIVYLLFFVGLDWLTRQFQVSTLVSIWYPPAGLNFAGLMVWGWAFAPWMVISNLISQYLIYQSTIPLAAVVLNIGVEIGVYGFVVYSLRRWVKINPYLTSVRDVLWLIVGVSVGAMVVPLISEAAAIIAGVDNWESYPVLVLTWWIGDMIGILTIAPAALNFGIPFLRRFGWWGKLSSQWDDDPEAGAIQPPDFTVRQLAFEHAAQLLLMMVVIAILAFWPPGARMQLVYLCFVPLTWMTLRQGVRGASFATLIMNAGITLIWTGYAYIAMEEISFQIFMVAMATFGLVLGAVVSEQQRNLKELRLHKEHYTQFLSGTRAAEWTLHLPARKVEVSEVGMQMLGYPALPNILDLDEFLEFIPEVEREIVEQRLNEHLHGETPYFEVEHQFQTLSGKCFWALGRGQVVERDREGKPILVLGTFRDITDRMQSTFALQESEQILSNLMGYFQDGVVVIDSKRQIRLWNHSLELITGRRGVDMEGKTLEEALISLAYPPPGPEEFEQARKEAEKYFASGKMTWSGQMRERRLQRPDGQVRMCQMSMFPLHALNGLMMGAFIRDVTAQKQYEESIWRQEAILEAVGFASQRFLTEGRWEESIEEVLGRLGESAQAGKAYLIELNHISDDQPVTRIHSLWENQPGTSPISAHSLMLADENFRVMSMWLKSLKQRKIIQGPKSSFRGAERQLLETAGVRGLILVPVFVKEDCWGCLGLEVLEGEYSWASAEADALKAAADILGAAILRQRAEGDIKRLYQNEHRLNELSRQMNNPLDLPAVLNNGLQLAAEVVGADAVVLLLRESEDNDDLQVFTYNLPQELHPKPRPRGQGSLSWKVIEERECLLLDEYSSHPMASPQMVALGVHAVISVPIMSGESALGVFSLYSLSVGKKFDANLVDLAELVGRQVGGAIQNARLYLAAQQRAEESERLSEAIAAVASELNLNQVLETLLVQLQKIVPYDSASVFITEGDWMVWKAARGFAHFDPEKPERFSRQYWTVQEMERTHKPLIVPDVQERPDFGIWGEDAHSLRGWMGLPLIVHGDLIGTLTIDSYLPDAYHEWDAALAMAFANEAAVALANARLFEQVQEMAIVDYLTALYNRRYFFERAEEEFSRSKRYHHPMAILMIDVDSFKQINDRYGHPVGDSVLAAVAAECKLNLRTVDVVARYGGDEFVALLPETTVEAAHLAAARLMKCIEMLEQSRPDLPVKISISIGVAALDANCKDLQMLLNWADADLLAHKHSGRK